jgi:GNAT superfamily N-acetyltransferase
MRQIDITPKRTLTETQAEGYPSRLYEGLKRQLYQQWVSYGLRRDLSVCHEQPEARIPITVREYREQDQRALFSLPPQQNTRNERLEIANRVALVAQSIPTCYVAVDTEHETPCFVQWLMTHEHNETIQSFFRGRFPRLAHDEALLENAYTPPQYRGMGIMSCAMAMISELAVSRGCRYVMTFVSRDNAASLKGCARAGFEPFVVRRDTHALFRMIRRRKFIPLDAG